jgi:hypothetical protein
MDTTTTGTRKALGLTYGETVTIVWGPQTFTGEVTESRSGWTLTLPAGDTRRVPTWKPASKVMVAA